MEENAKLAAQKDARMTRQKLAETEVTKVYLAHQRSGPILQSQTSALQGSLPQGWDVSLLTILLTGWLYHKSLAWPSILSKLIFKGSKLQVKLLEATNARVRAEMMSQKAEADITVMKRSQRKGSATEPHRGYQDDEGEDWKDWLHQGGSSTGKWRP